MADNGNPPAYHYRQGLEPVIAAGLLQPLGSTLLVRAILSQDSYKGLAHVDDRASDAECHEVLAVGPDVKDVKPGQQIELPKTAIYDQGNSLIRFEPTEGAAVEKYDVGVHKVTVLFWKIEEGRNTARSFSWSFEVL
jgi:hypothetical protein